MPKKSSTSPTARTLKELARQGYLAGVVERRLPTIDPKTKKPSSFLKDLFGFIDIIAIKDDVTLGVQATSRANMSARVAKIQAEPNARRWLLGQCRRRIEVWGWAKYKEGNSLRWRQTVVEVTLDGVTKTTVPTMPKRLLNKQKTLFS